MKLRSQYKKNQISVSEFYEKTKQKSNFNENEKYQSDKKKTDSKITADEIEMNFEFETINSFQYSILFANFKLTSTSHVILKSFVRK